jgi:hypothetical protein
VLLPSSLLITSSACTPNEKNQIVCTGPLLVLTVGSGDVRQMGIPSPLEDNSILASWGVRGLHSCPLTGSCKLHFCFLKKRYRVW